jgi:hypothetical protein
MIGKRITARAFGIAQKQMKCFRWARLAVELRKVRGSGDYFGLGCRDAVLARTDLIFFRSDRLTEQAPK